MALRATQSTARMAANLRRVARPFSTDAVVESDYKRGEIGKVSGIPEEHLARKVIIYSPARTATQQGSGKLGKWKINFVSTLKYPISLCFCFVILLVYSGIWAHLWIHLDVLFDMSLMISVVHMSNRIMGLTRVAHQHSNKTRHHHHKERETKQSSGRLTERSVTSNRFESLSTLVNDES